MIAHGEFEVACHGGHLEIVPGQRIVTTEVYEAMPGPAALVTTTSADHDGSTTVSLLMVPRPP